MNSCCLKLNRAYSISFSLSNVGNFWELSSEGLYQSSRKEKESCCPVFPSSTKREIRHFHVVVVQRRLRNVQKSVMHVQSCCFPCLNLLLFCRSRCRHRRRCLSSLALSTRTPSILVISNLVSLLSLGMRAIVMAPELTMRYFI